MPVARINYALAAAMIASGATLEETAPKVGAKNAHVLRVGLSRKDVSRRNIERLPVTLKHHGRLVDSVAAQAVEKASERLRETFGDLLARHVGALAKVPVKSNLKHLARVGQVMEPLARTAKIVHGWDSQDKAGLLLEMCDAGAVIEIEPTCVPEATISGVPEPTQLADTPQVTQDTESQDNAS